MDSPFWRVFMNGKEDFFARGDFENGNGLTTRFWEDSG
jgi:hypothetical protein